MDIYFRVAFKPVSTLMKDQKSIDASGKELILEGKGRHDPVYYQEQFLLLRL